MAKKKKKKKEDTEQPALAHTAAYDEAVIDYTAAVESMQKGDFAGAHELFEKVGALGRQEPELTDRAGIYAKICHRKMAPPPDEAEAPDERYRQAVFLLNSGEVDQALQLLNRSLAEDPTAVDVLYVRACAWALKGAAEKAVGDLRQAMAADPKIRFQAVNDPDFEKIREEPAFIDIIEPTPTGV